MDIIWLNQNPSIHYEYPSSARRYVNNILVGLQTRLKTRRVFGYPRHLIVDLVNICGLGCPICPNGRKEIPRSPGMMTPALFKTIMKTLGPQLFTLTLTNWGEPLRHPDLPELLAIARAYPCYIGFSSNLQHFPDKLMDEVIMSGVDEIGVSIDGANAETYSKYRVGGDFDTTLQNLRRMISRRHELGRTKPKIRWQVLLNRFTENETDAVISLARSVGVDSVMFVPILIDISGMFTRTPIERLQRDGDWLPANPDYSIYDTQSGRLKGDPHFCTKIWDTMVIHPDGAVSPCCAVIDPADDFGKLKEDGNFWKIWNGKLYQKARMRMAGKKSEPGAVVCDHCRRHGVLIY